MQEVSDTNPIKDVVLFLGSFYTFLNLLGAKRTLVDGSGLEDILKTIYGENAVVHMMSGKAVQRSFRGHLVYQSLSQQIVTKVTLDEPQFENLVEEMKRMYVLVDKGEIVLDTLLQSNCKALNKKRKNCF